MKTTVTKNIRLETDINTFSFIVKLQNLIQRKANKKVSMRKLILYYFFKGLSVNLSRKEGFVQEFIQKGRFPLQLKTELIKIDSQIDQFPDDISATLAGLDEKDLLLQRDLIDQYHLLQSKELRLIKKEEELTKLEVNSSNYRQENHNLKINLMTKEAKVEILESRIEFEKRFTEMYKENEEKLYEETKELRSENNELRKNFSDIKKMLEKILSNTDELYKSEKSLVNQIIKFAAPVLAYFGAQKGVNSSLKSFDIKTIIKEVVEATEQLSAGSKKELVDKKEEEVED